MRRRPFQELVRAPAVIFLAAAEPAPLLRQARKVLEETKQDAIEYTGEVNEAELQSELDMQTENLAQADKEGAEMAAAEAAKDEESHTSAAGAEESHEMEDEMLDIEPAGPVDE